MIQELQLCRPRYEELISLQLRNIFILISRAIMSAKIKAAAIRKIDIQQYQIKFPLVNSFSGGSKIQGSPLH